jgi:DNA-binding NarL/FixJ family response regulator
MFKVEVREMSLSNETSSFNYISGNVYELLEKVRVLEDKLEQKEIQLERSRGRLDEIFNLISGMLSVDGLTTDTETTRLTIEDSFQRVASLTARQHQIMKLVLAGQPSKNIATDIGICQRTVENHRAIIMKKTGSASISGLAWRFIAAIWFNGEPLRRQQPTCKAIKQGHGSAFPHSGEITQLRPGT